MIVIGSVAGLGLAAGAAPLAGRTVVVTRARAQNDELGSALLAAGARVVELPMIAIEEAGDGGAALRRAVVAQIHNYDWVAFTSANAVRRVAGLLRDGRSLGAARLAAVGRATTDALARCGSRRTWSPTPSTAAGLAEAFAAAPPGGRVLFPRAAAARAALPDGLAAKGWTVDEVDAYRTVAAPPPPDDVIATLAGAEVVTFTSPSTVAGYLSLSTIGGHALPVPPVVACIGPVTAAAARKAGLDVVVESPSPSGEAFVAAVVARLGHRPATS